MIMVMNVGQSQNFQPVSVSEFMLSEWMSEVAVGMLDCLYALYDNVESELIEF